MGNWSYFTLLMGVISPYLWELVHPIYNCIRGPPCRKLDYIFPMEKPPNEAFGGSQLPGKKRRGFFRTLFYKGEWASLTKTHVINRGHL